MTYNNHHPQSGFTLIELSIVIVIIGMLVGGVLMGQNLIRNADLQTIVTDAAKYKAAAKQFSDKYLAIPGDFSEATGVWGKDNVACTGDTGTTAIPGTCNGNGNGTMNEPASAGATGEIYQFWKQLQLEGSVKGNFSGVSGPTSIWDVVAGINAPKAKADGAWAVYTHRNYAGDTSMYSLDYGNYFIFGALTANWGPNLTPEEAWAIDTKIDDGKPGYGEVIARFWGNLTSDNKCSINAANNADLDSDYNLGYKIKICALYFVRAF